jgi:putative transcriptional regulator
MAITRKTLEDLRSNPRRLNAAERARLDAMTQEEIERNALEDRDNPPASEEELARAVAARAVRRARQRTGLSQAKFAERFQINLARLKDWEQGRFMPDTVALAYLKVIERDPEAVARALDAA